MNRFSAGPPPDDHPQLAARRNFAHAATES
jgi:hypothetical protein